MGSLCPPQDPYLELCKVQDVPDLTQGWTLTPKPSLLLRPQLPEPLVFWSSGMASMKHM